ncbi:MAG TPA: fibronectin type III domain-containing protein [Flavobacteriales bacterium]|jgi:hypothetical protein|nr:fibronectin type III domain-containing protein [Flavobacteriales bacterium]MBK6552183.1 fibronectin type III domain-containing protein [Flavobacteriales bacterium]MBK8530267.1 fibronectin type III domain-containing protein [Flavobacteriales bacterium]MBK9628811.1 fibronectin type III domain-containing protein [Flavobacteriales bacterium]MBP8878833.1 fibronectin type III domain-containing protein [Flavobacteriales bacterium]
MRIIKAGLSGLRVADLVGKTKHVISKMTGNVSFASPSPSLAEVSATLAILEAAIPAAQDRSSSAIATKNSTAKKLHGQLVQLARYVNSVAGGDIDMAVRSGFELAKVPDPIDKLEAPSNFNGHTGTIAGEVLLRWKGVRGGRLYYTYKCDGDPTNAESTWTLIGTTSKARITVKGLITDKQYSFRVSAVGAVGEGPMSEKVTAKAA